MSFSVTTTQFTSNKNCFVALPANVSKQSSKENTVHVFELNYGEDRKAYVSWSGETTKSSSDTDGILKINGLYANKLNLKDGEPVIVRSLNSVPFSKQVSVEPLSFDDWEILEHNAAFVESHLQDQLRVVWKSQVFPIWVEKSVCLFLKISAIEPDVDCVILTDDTEVIVSPKVRTSAIGPSKNQSEKDLQNQQPKKVIKKAQSFAGKTNTSPSKENKAKVPKTLHYFDDDDIDTIASPTESTDKEISPVWRWKDWIPWLLGVDKSSSDFVHTKKKISMNTEKETFPSHSVLQGGVNFTFRVQSLKDFDRRKRKATSEPYVSKINVAEKIIRQGKCSYVHQPNIVFVNVEDIQDQMIDKDAEIPEVFFAKLTKLKSPKEQLSAAEKENAKSKKSIDFKNSKESNSKQLEDLNFDQSAMINCIVRVVVIDKKKAFSSEELTELVSEALEEQPCLQGHVIIPNILRRLMNLDVTGRIWLKTVGSVPVKTTSCFLHSVGSLPSRITGLMIQKAFTNWLKMSADHFIPLVVFQGILIKFPVFQEVCFEFQMTFTDERSTPDNNNSYCLIYNGNLPTCNLASNVKTSELKTSKGPLMSMLQYIDVANFDPQVPNIKLKLLGGIQDYAEHALNHIEASIGIKPLSNTMFTQTTPGMRNGMLLITGAKGSGKTSLAKAICRHFAELPNSAYTTIVDCKPLRGKKPDSILKILDLIFDEAVWRQPAIIVLDDLDLVAPAPSGPEAEMSGEAIYGARIAEVLKDVFRKEIFNGSSIAIIGTCQSRNSIHPLVVASRGTHFVQETINMVPPDKERRKDILKTILQNRPSIAIKTVDGLNFDWLLSKSEGFVASDFDSLVSRAVHAHVLIHGNSQNMDHEIFLTQKDFENAMDGFTPASIRNVPLHTSGELGWEDVGGLMEVKKMLRETLEWPSKYPVLFANSPLRLRSGLLLYGAPGTGKTLLAGVVAKECGVNFISIKGPELLSKYIGASEQAVRDTFVRAQSAKPCILFFDEFDSIAPRRGHDNTGVTDRVVNQLLTQLDGVEGLEGVYVLAATSRPDLIDPALLRPGRLDRCVACNLPTKDERLKILQALTRNMNISEDVELSLFADKCEYFTGADFKALLYNAQLESIHEVTGGFFNQDTGNTKKFSRLSPRKSQTNIGGQKVIVRERRKSWIDNRVTYIPKLEEGITTISDEMADKLNFQVEHVKAKLKVKKSTENVRSSENPFSPLVASKTQIMEVRQSHLLKALDKTRPSVNEEERHKYNTIYENFISSRGGNFGPAIPDLEQRQTLA